MTGPQWCRRIQRPEVCLRRDDDSPVRENEGERRGWGGGEERGNDRKRGREGELSSESVSTENIPAS